MCCCSDRCPGLQRWRRRRRLPELERPVKSITALPLPLSSRTKQSPSVLSESLYSARKPHNKYALCKSSCPSPWAAADFPFNLAGIGGLVHWEGLCSGKQRCMRSSRGIPDVHFSAVQENEENTIIIWPLQHTWLGVFPFPFGTVGK